ncbi:MAG: M50 family metallopeptidase [Acidimicrobiia bacterium]|nr:M50 family metallopeptidase [Acidimicrobiia bacterium]
MREAPVAIADLTKESVAALGRMFSLDGLSSYRDVLVGADSGDDSGNDTGGAAEGERFISPVGFGRLANQAVVAGWVSTAFLLISINVFVGIFNMMPLLPFDGGHVAIATYERIMSSIRRRRVQVDAAKLLLLDRCRRRRTRAHLPLGTLPRRRTPRAGSVLGSLPGGCGRDRRPRGASREPHVRS